MINPLSNFLKRTNWPDRKQVVAAIKRLPEKIIILAITAYMVASVGQSVIKNYKVNQQITDLKQRINVLEQEKSYLEVLIGFYKTKTFKELKVRELLGWRKPDEQVISVPVDPEDRPNDQNSKFVAEPTVTDVELTNYEKWFSYFFDL